MTEPRRASERQPDLDGLRGLAAFAVFAHHALLLVPALSNAALSGTRVIDGGGWDWLVKSPLHALWGGYEAVLVFFLLSGFVLFMAVEQSSGYLPFVAKRIVRLYPVYAVVVVGAFIVRFVVYRGTIPGSSGWLSSVWVGADRGALLRHLTLIGPFPVSAIDPVVWSLVHEARISLVFPLVALLVRRVGALATIALGVGLVVAGSVAGKVLKSDLCTTIQYLGPFLVGATMARHRMRLKRMASWGVARQMLVVGVSILGLSYYWWFPWRSSVAINVITRDIAALMGAAGLIAIAYSGVATRILSARPIHWLGRVSYSFYLVHAVVLLAVVHATRDLDHWAVTVGVALLLSLGLAQLTFVLVERPSIRWGRLLAQRLVAKKSAMASSEA